ncbi:MAG: M56 family metallopeptidase [Lachnospiraceae bacterium]|nr:M56 family metallopeptidase [Lachnospiraceae bacterium]
MINPIFQTVLSMSLSGTLLILVLLFGGRLWKKKLSRQWQYYIWLVVLLRLFLPFGPEASLMARAEQAAQRAMIQITERTPGESLSGQSSEQSLDQRSEENGIFYGNESAAVPDLQESESSLNDQEIHWKGSVFLGNESTVRKVAGTAWKYLGIIWLAAAFAILIRKMTVYQSYIRYVTIGAEPVNDTALLDGLAVTAQEMGIGRPIELRVNPLVASPMLVGYFHPCIVLPRADVSEEAFQYIVMHELTHYKRRDIIYKWLVQLAVCLHWFNPFVYVMRREIELACEFACDEAVIRRTGYGRAKAYGETLLGAMVAVGAYREPLAAVTMSANKELLKERLGAIMNGGKKTKMAAIITAGLTVGIILGAVFIGVFPTVAADKDGVKVQSGKAEVAETDADKAIAEVEDLEKYYSGRSLPMFYAAFGKLDEKEQEAWLDRIYVDGEIDFFSVSVWQLDADSPLIPSFAEKFYEEDDIAFFSVLADQMDEKTLEKWLERALADEKWNFQSMLDDELGRDDEQDALEKAKEEEQLAQYKEVGVIQNGKNYYYEGQLVNIFLDIHMPNRSFYTLNMNPAGTVNIKIIRAQDGQITGVAYMTEAEVKELLEDRYEDEEEDSEAEADEEAAETGVGVTEADEQENEDFPREMVVSLPVCRIREGAGEAFQVIGLSGEGEVVTVLEKKEAMDGCGICWIKSRCRSRRSLLWRSAISERTYCRRSEGDNRVYCQINNPPSPPAKYPQTESLYLRSAITGW